MNTLETTNRRKQEKLYVYKSTLRTVYGLTPSMIAELGEPDKYCDNPHWQTGPFLASLYLITRVEAWIEANRERVEKARGERARRSAASKAAHERKRLERERERAERERERAERLRPAKEWVNGFVITVHKPFPDTLLADARKVYRFRGHADCLKEKALHAYVRHRLTNYDALRRQFTSHEFSGELYHLLRKRVDSAVTDALLEWRHKTEERLVRAPQDEANRQPAAA